MHCVKKDNYNIYICEYGYEHIVNTTIDWEWTLWMKDLHSTIPMQSTYTNVKIHLLVNIHNILYFIFREFRNQILSVCMRALQCQMSILRHKHYTFLFQI